MITLISRWMLYFEVVDQRGPKILTWTPLSASGGPAIDSIEWFLALFDGNQSNDATWPTICFAAFSSIFNLIRVLPEQRVSLLKPSSLVEEANHNQSNVALGWMSLNSRRLLEIFQILFRCPSDTAGKVLSCEVSSFPKRWKSFPPATCKILYCMGSSKLN